MNQAKETFTIPLHIEPSEKLFLDAWVQIVFGDIRKDICIDVKTPDRYKSQAWLDTQFKTDFDAWEMRFCRRPEADTLPLAALLEKWFQQKPTPYASEESHYIPSDVQICYDLLCGKLKKRNQ